MADLDPRLASDTLMLGRLALCRLLIMNDSTYPWFILVPDRDDLVEIHDLDEADGVLLMGEITRLSRGVSRAFRPEKVNVAALGNVVRQLHVHVIARFRHDPAWPGPVWGRSSPEPYGPEALAATRRRIIDALGPDLVAVGGP
jgi:diadenosine tetraphosphate (Ap4A) HIT family hydrolase